MGRKVFVRKKVLQALFTDNGTLLVQKILNPLGLSDGPERRSLQETLDKWLYNVKDNLPPIHEDILYNDDDRCLSYVDDKLSIDDEWDGSIDNAEKTLEEHVSKYGWMF
ncbi:MAG: hypothetical protein QW782_06295 [Candidatus Bathyarchaeia archaeon]